MVPKVMPSSGMAPMDRNMMARKATPKKLRASAGSWLWPLKRDPTINAMMSTCKRSQAGFLCVRGMRLAENGRGLSLILKHGHRQTCKQWQMPCRQSLLATRTEVAYSSMMTALPVQSLQTPAGAPQIQAHKSREDTGVALA